MRSFRARRDDEEMQEDSEESMDWIGVRDWKFLCVICSFLVLSASTGCVSQLVLGIL